MLQLTRMQLDTMATHGADGYPHEVCGLLVGRFSGDRQVRTVLEVHPTGNNNTERAHDRYDLDPIDYMRIETDAEARGLEVVGVYHTHPDHPSRASETDRQRAADVWGDAESWSYLILAIHDGKLASQQSWVLRKGAFDEEPVTVSPQAEPRAVD